MKMAMRPVLRTLLCSSAWFFAPNIHADMIFNVAFTAQAQAQLSASEQQLFLDAVDFWDGVIVDHRDGVSRNWTMTINTFSQAASGGSVVLGSAGPSSLAFSNVVGDSHTSNKRFIISTSGIANFNTHADAGALRLDTIKHEMGHALGFGTLWEDNEVYNDGTSGNSNRTLAGGTPGQDVGEAALAQWQTEFGQTGATFVDVETGFGPGTNHGHWNEDDTFGIFLTGIVDPLGRDMRDELMTGFATQGGSFVSNMTQQSFFDIGFNVVPEPSGFLLAGIACFGLVWRSRRRRRYGVTSETHSPV